MTIDSERGPIPFLNVATKGVVRTSKRALDSLSENFGRDVLLAFVGGLGSIDSRMRPARKPDGSFTVPKSATGAADLVSILPKLDVLGGVISGLIRAVSEADAQAD